MPTALTFNPAARLPGPCRWIVVQNMDHPSVYANHEQQKCKRSKLHAQPGPTIGDYYDQRGCCEDRGKNDYEQLGIMGS